MGASGSSSAYGRTTANGSVDPQAARSRSASEASPLSDTLRSTTPLSIGFIADTRSPSWRARAAKAHDTTVLPIPVSVPVTP